jgi:serine/threonine protein kinase
MEYVNGMELYDKILNEKSGAIGERQVASYIEQLFKALNHCHANGVVHRDVKP